MMSGTRNEDIVAQGVAMLRAIIGAIVEYPAAIDITSKHLDPVICYTVKVHDEDQGKVIGRSGLHIRSIQQIMFHAGKNIQRSVRVKLITDDRLGFGTIGEPRENPDYDPAPAVELLRNLIGALVDDRSDVQAVKSGGKVTFKTLIESQSEFKALENPQLGARISTKDALQAIWKAYGKKEGIEFVLNLSHDPA